MMNTYILYDKDTGLYKIGKSGQVDKRLRKLCIQNIEPYNMFNGDIEAELHERFKENRVIHPFVDDGKTEWFRFGGKFKEFIEDLGKRDIPYLNPHNIYAGMDEESSVHYDRAQTEAELEYYEEYYKLKLGQKILILLGYIYYGPEGYSTNHPEIQIQGYKILVTKRVYDDIVNNYELKVVKNTFKSAINNTVKGKVYVRRINDMWMILNRKFDNYERE